MTAPDPSSDDDLVLARASARRLRDPSRSAASFVDPSASTDGAESGFAPIRAAVAAREKQSGREVCVACIGLPKRSVERAEPASPPLVATVADVVERARAETPNLPFDLHSIEATGVAAWNKLLSWATATTGSHGAFVTDRDGLLIATHGSALSPGGFDLIGPHIVVAFSQLPALGDPPAAAQWAVIHCGSERVVAIRFETSLTGEVLLVLLMQSDPPSRTIDRVIAATNAFVKIT
ncbi:MAG: hypothetical protein U0269_20450 [Polyangiales bacterium]